MAYTTINKPTDHFNTVLYTGDGTTSNSITGVGFQPDFTWIKARDGATNYYHYLQDAVRGSLNVIFTNTTDAEQTYTQSVKSFDSDGFTTGSQAATNDSGDNFVAWNWLAGNSTSANTDGSISSTVSVNTTAGFSIVSYTGTGSNATVGHGLGTEADMVIIRNRDISAPMWISNRKFGFTRQVRLNQTTQVQTEISVFNNTAPTSTVFSVGTNSGSNGSGNDLIAYCFAEKKGYSKFGTYTANANTDGPFVYTGFKPAFIIAKNATIAQTWIMIDNKRDSFNEVSKLLAPSSANLEADSSGNVGTDFLSNGFKIRAVSTGDLNYSSGHEYLYMAFAEAPLVGTNKIPATAR